MRDVIVIGGGFAGVTAAREAALRGRSVTLLEARARLGGRTWNAPWDGTSIEYGGAWVHWHQPHTWAEISRAGLRVELSADPGRASWYVGDQRHEGSIEDRDELARRGWDQFVEGVESALPMPHDPLFAIEELGRFDRLSIADRLEQLALPEEGHAVLAAELESLAHAPIDQAGAVSVLRWHALSGFSLALTQFTGGRVTLERGTGSLLGAIAGEAPFELRLETPVAAVRRSGDQVEVEMRSGELTSARAVVVAVPLNVLSAIEFSPPLSESKRAAAALGQASRGIKIFIRARGEALLQNAIRAGHPFGYLDSETLLEDGSQTMIGFGPDADMLDAGDLAAVQRELNTIMPGYEAMMATAHDWLADEFSRGTWAIHRPGWYQHYHAAMQEPEGRVVLAGSDIANGWAGFIDGAIESGLRAGRAAGVLGG
ncbi:MAG: FAD-dependent oxidoreductase [Actinomycetota bacterium]|nr:FAD-dependent oxidoreductase [Actinomycetota bacterium]